MMYLHSEKVLKMRSNRQNRFRYDLFRVLTSSDYSVNINVNMPVFSAIFNGFGHHMSEHQLSPATIWKFQIVPRKVLEQKLKAAVAIARERLEGRGNRVLSPGQIVEEI